MTTVVRLYGVGRAEDAAREATRICEGPLAALVESVPTDDWSADALPGRLEDLDWLEVQARRHDAVLRAQLPAPVVPFPLTTVFSDDESVRRMLVERRDELAHALARIQGRVELGVVVHVDRQATAVRPEPAAAITGTDYIASRLRRRQEGDLSRASAATMADHVHERLSALAIDSVRDRPRPAALDEDPGWNVLNASYLVPLDAVAAFDDEVRALDAEHAAAGTRVRRTGPWAPFHFVGDRGDR